MYVRQRFIMSVAHNSDSWTLILDTSTTCTWILCNYILSTNHTLMIDIYIYIYLYISVWYLEFQKTQTKKVHTDIQYVGSYAIRFQHWNSHEPWDFELNKPVDVAQEPSYGNKPWLLYNGKSIQTNGWFSGTPRPPPILGNHGQYLIPQFSWGDW